MSDTDREWAAALDRHRPALLQMGRRPDSGLGPVQARSGGSRSANFARSDSRRATSSQPAAPRGARFLRRSLTNNLIDAARKFGRSRSDVSPDALAESSGRLADWLVAADTSPSERAARNERYARLAAELAALPDDQRIAVEMRYLQGLKVTAIAMLLDRSEGAVSQLLRRAVGALRNGLAEFGS